MTYIKMGQHTPPVWLCIYRYEIYKNGGTQTTSKEYNTLGILKGSLATTENIIVYGNVRKDTIEQS